MLTVEGLVKSTNMFFILHLCEGLLDKFEQDGNLLSYIKMKLFIFMHKVNFTPIPDH